MPSSTKATSVRFDESTLARLDALAQTVGKSRSEAVAEAVERYLQDEEHFLAKVDEGLRAADQGRFATDQQVSAVFEKWGVKRGQVD